LIVVNSVDKESTAYGKLKYVLLNFSINEWQ
jgi:hypothetical protein